MNHIFNFGSFFIKSDNIIPEGSFVPLGYAFKMVFIFELIFSTSKVSNELVFESLPASYGIGIQVGETSPSSYNQGKRKCSACQGLPDTLKGYDPLEVLHMMAGVFGPIIIIRFHGELEPYQEFMRFDVRGERILAISKRGLILGYYLIHVWRLTENYQLRIQKGGRIVKHLTTNQRPYSSIDG